MVSAYDLLKSAKSPFSRFCSLLLLSLAAFFLTFHILTPNAFSSQVTLAWDPNTEPELAGYKLYYGNASQSYSQVIDVGDTTLYTTNNLTNGNTYYFAVTAYDTSGYESEYSNEVSTTVAEQFALTVQKSGTGTGTITGTGINCGNECANTYNAGAIVMLTAMPEAGSTFGGWSGGGCAGTGQCVMNMNANKTVTALFNAATYTITAQSGAGGRITPAGAIPVKRGSDRTFAIIPNLKYRIANVTVDGMTAGAVSTYTFRNVTANHWIAATFTRR
jgi:hypothetical protein